MSVKRLLLIMIAVVTVIMSPLSVCFAADSAALYQVCAWERNIDVFVTGSMNPDSLSVKVSNQAAEVVESGFLTDKGITVRTTLLIDISTSMPAKIRGKVKDYLNSVIESTGKNEQYKIVTFGQDLDVLQDFTSDRYDLSNTVGKIVFDAQESKIYDAVYNTIPTVQPIEGSPCLYRTVVITDGVDDTLSGVTEEELYLKLQGDAYPVDIIAVSAAKQAEENKELSALTRISGGSYRFLNTETNVSTLTSNPDFRTVFWMRAVIPDSLLDGSTRQINITDGANSLQFDTKVPVFDVPASVPPASSEDPPMSEQPVESTIPSHSKAPVAPAESAPSGSLFGEYSVVVYLGVGIGLFLLLLIIVVILVIGKQQKKTSIDGSGPKKGAVMVHDKTEMLTDSVPRSENGIPCICLRNEAAADQLWNVGLAKEVFIGRDTDSQICIPDASVSRRQCRLYMGNGATIENLSKSNVTRLNGDPLTSSAEIKMGDKIKCGRITLIVELLYTSDSCDTGDLNKNTFYINV